jgi:ribosomal protein S18 acetylase RimI-like enzyme
MFTVKPLKTKEDALKIIEFYFSKDAFQHIWAPGEKDMVKNAVLTSLKDGDHHQYWFVEDREKIIGALGVNENKYQSGGYEMADDYVAVHQNYRKQGIGSLLLKTMESFVRQNKGRYIHIETCDIPYYKPARLFYKKNNYEKVGEMPDYFNIGEGRVDYYKKLI